MSIPKIAILISTFFLLDYAAHAQFEEVGVEAGLNHNSVTQVLIGGGATFLDFNNDGLEDLYATGGIRTDKLYMNIGNFRFSDVSLESKVAGYTAGRYTSGAISGDINNDGCEDIFVSTFDRVANILLLNNCDGTFTNIAASAGFAEKARSMGAAFTDFNEDGFLDIYVTNYIIESKFVFDEDGNAIGFDHTCESNYFYVNNGNGTFTEKAVDLGIDDDGCGLAVMSTDFDLDNDQDLYVANDFGEFITPNKLYVNNNSVFEEKSAERVLDGHAFAMGIANGDVDNDGYSDYYITDIGDNLFFKHKTDGTYEEVAKESKVENGGYDNGGSVTSWGTFFFDYDNDKDLDLFVSNGFINSAAYLNATLLDENALFANDGSGIFSDISIEAGVNSDRINRTAIYSDIDNDGRLDFFVSTITKFPNETENSLLYQNVSTQTGNWLQVKLEGTESNRNAFGTIARIKLGDEVIMRELFSGGSHASQNTQILHFGLASESSIDELELTWPNGLVQKIPDPPVNQRLFISEGKSAYEVLGCTDTNSNNYNPLATKNSGCNNLFITGCMDLNASNRNPEATIDDGSCSYVNGLNKATRKEIELEVYPNPTRDRLSIKSKDAIISISLYDNYGRLVLKHLVNSTEHIINTTTLNPGVYLLKSEYIGNRVENLKIHKY